MRFRGVKQVAGHHGDRADHHADEDDVGIGEFVFADDPGQLDPQAGDDQDEDGPDQV